MSFVGWQRCTTVADCLSPHSLSFPGPHSKRLSAWRPIVILAQKMPLAGTAWDDIARLKDVYYVQVTNRVSMAPYCATCLTPCRVDTLLC